MLVLRLFLHCDAPSITVFRTISYCRVWRFRDCFPGPIQLSKYESVILYLTETSLLPNLIHQIVPSQSHKHYDRHLCDYFTAI